MLLLALSAPAGATCVELDDGAFRSRLLEAQVAVDRGDATVHRSVVAELERDVPCARFVPSQRGLADLLLQLALVRFGEAGDWEPALRTGLWLRPTLDRGVGGAHPMASYEAPDREVEWSELSASGEVHVDGERASRFPVDGGLHLVQRYDRGLWQSVLTMEPPGSAWLRDPIPDTRPWRGRITAVVAADATSHTQVRSDDLGSTEGVYAPDDAWTTPAPALGLRGEVAYRVGVARAEVEVVAPGLELPSGSRAVAYVGGMPTGDWGVGVGGGVTWVGVLEGDLGAAVPSYRRRALPLWFGGASVWSHGDRIDSALAVGGGPAALVASARGGVSLGRRSPLSVGVRARFTMGWLGQEGSSVRVVDRFASGGVELRWSPVIGVRAGA